MAEPRGTSLGTKVVSRSQISLIGTTLSGGLSQGIIINIFMLQPDLIRIEEHYSIDFISIARKK